MSRASSPTASSETESPATSSACFRYLPYATNVRLADLPNFLLAGDEFSLEFEAGGAAAGVVECALVEEVGQIISQVVHAAVLEVDEEDVPGVPKLHNVEVVEVVVAEPDALLAHGCESLANVLDGFRDEVVFDKLEEF